MFSLSWIYLNIFVIKTMFYSAETLEFLSAQVYVILGES